MRGALNSWSPTTLARCRTVGLWPLTRRHDFAESSLVGGLLARRRLSHSASRLQLSIPATLANLPSLTEAQHHSAARQWTEAFAAQELPWHGIETSYSRSSGPGGQHVNKTNSKATVRLDLGMAQDRWLPAYVMSPLRNSPHFHPSPPSLLISSQTSRSAPTNLADALRLLHSTILSAARSVIVGETSPEQREKVKGLARREEARRRDTKMRVKSKKAARRGDD